MGKAVTPLSHHWDGDQLTVCYASEIALVLDRIQPDRYGRLWAEVVARVGEDVVNQARLDLLDQRQRIDFHGAAHARDGQVDWQAHMVPVIALARQGPPAEASGDITPKRDPWPVLDKEHALHGLAGITAMAIDPYTEADPVAVLLNVLTASGNVIGPQAHFRVEHTRHYLRLFVCLVGATSKGRKGTSWSTPRHMFRAIDEAWVDERVSAGLSSGEGLIFHVRDKRIEKQAVKVKGHIVDYEEVIVDHGVDDKRLLIIESEFSQALKMASREGNILSETLRQAWETGSLHPLTKNNPVRATNAHVSLIGHITHDELLRHLDDTEQANGFANRFLWAFIRRSKKIANPTGTPDHVLNPLIIRLQRAIDAAKQIGEMRRDPEAEHLWEGLYEELSEGQPGLFGAITARAEVQVMRLAAVYAALDSTALIQVCHLQAALAVWRYCEASARLIFGDNTGDPIADKILSALREKPMMPKTKLSGALGRNVPAAEFDSTLSLLLKWGRISITEVKNPQGGRPVTMIAMTLKG
jgi:hypothetical protein